MEEMKASSPYKYLLLNLPVEITEEIFLYLALLDRKNLRLTCKQLYDLCNSYRFCRHEKIKWSEDLVNHLNAQSDLHRIGRSYYNLVISNTKLEKSSILPFFQKLGTKILSLVIKECLLPADVLESIIMLCEGLCSLSLEQWKASSDFLTLEPFSITRPNVTNLKITLPRDKRFDYFHRMSSIFPNVKQLHLDVPRQMHAELNTDIYTEVYSRRNWGSETEEDKKSTVFEALPNLKELTVDFHVWYSEILSETVNWYPRCSNLVSIELRGLRVFRPPELIRLFTNTRLKNLKVETFVLVFDKQSFEKLVALKLNELELFQCEILGPPVTVIDSSLDANKTVENFCMSTSEEYNESAQMLFFKYFRGLIHLTLTFVTDSILQCIFKFQENLRSLELGMCRDCSINGFCGSEYSINNLKKLEHLTIQDILPQVIESDELKSAFSLLRLKYLHIRCCDWTYSNGNYVRTPRNAQIPTVLYENLTELRALRLKNGAIPSYETLSSLFRNLKLLNYLCYDIPHSKELLYSQIVTELFENSTELRDLRLQETARSRDHTKVNHVSIQIHSVTFIKVNCEFSLTLGKYDLAHTHYNKALDRMVILRTRGWEPFYSSKIGTFKIKWINF